MRTAGGRPVSLYLQSVNALLGVYQESKYCETMLYKAQTVKLNGDELLGKTNDSKGGKNLKGILSSLICSCSCS